MMMWSDWKLSCDQLDLQEGEGEGEVVGVYNSYSGAQVIELKNQGRSKELLRIQNIGMREQRTFVSMIISFYIVRG